MFYMIGSALEEVRKDDVIGDSNQTTKISKTMPKLVISQYHNTDKLSTNHSHSIQPNVQLFQLDCWPNI